MICFLVVIFLLLGSSVAQQRGTAVCSCPPDGTGCTPSDCGWSRDLCNVCCSDLYYQQFGWAPHHSCNWMCACSGQQSSCRLKLSDCRAQCQGPNTGVNFNNAPPPAGCFCKCTCSWANQAACASYCGDIGYLVDEYAFSETTGECKCTCKAPPTPPPTWKPGCTGTCPQPQCDAAPSGCQWVTDNALDECDCPLHPCGTLSCSECTEPCRQCTQSEPAPGCKWLPDDSITTCGCKVWPCGVPTCSCQCPPPPGPTECAALLPTGCSYGDLTQDVDACGCIKFPCGVVNCPPTPAPTPAPTNQDAPTVNCVLSEWSDWSPDPCHCDQCPCNKFRKRTRTILTPQSGNGTSCATTLESERCSCDPPTPVPQPTYALAPTAPPQAPGIACTNERATCTTHCGERAVEQCPCTGPVLCVGDIVETPGTPPFVWALVGTGAAAFMGLAGVAVWYYNRLGRIANGASGRDPLAAMTALDDDKGGKSRRRRSRSMSKQKVGAVQAAAAAAVGTAPPPKPGQEQQHAHQHHQHHHQQQQYAQQYDQINGGGTIGAGGYGVAGGGYDQVPQQQYAQYGADAYGGGTGYYGGGGGTVGGTVSSEYLANGVAGQQQQAGYAYGNQQYQYGGGY